MQTGTVTALRQFAVGLITAAVLTACQSNTGVKPLTKTPQFSQVRSAAPVIEGWLHKTTVVIEADKIPKTAGGKPSTYHWVLFKKESGIYVDVASSVSKTFAQSGLFRATGGDPLTLDAKIVELQDRGAGYQVTAGLAMRYVLRDGKQNVLFDKLVRSTGQASVNEFFSGTTRVKAGVQRALKANLFQVLNDMKSAVPAAVAAQKLNIHSPTVAQTAAAPATTASPSRSLSTSSRPRLGDILVTPFNSTQVTGWRQKPYYDYWTKDLRKLNGSFERGGFGELLNSRLKSSNGFSRQGGDPLTLRAQVMQIQDTSKPSSWAYDYVQIKVRYTLTTAAGEPVLEHVVTSVGHDDSWTGTTRAKKSIRNAWNNNVSKLATLLDSELEVAWQRTLSNRQTARQTEQGQAVSTGRPVSVNRPQGIYRFDEEVTFNVLDSIAIDPATGKLSFVGHSDPRYSGPRIPYLHHLAAFLQNPKPEFSLEWTADSERKIDAFMRRMDDPAGMKGFASGLGEWLNADGSPTRLGRQMLPLIGVRPTNNGAAPGYLGMTVSATGDWYLDIASVVPGSPAARAGILGGDSIPFADQIQFWHPVDFQRHIRRIGAGGKLKISVSTPGRGIRNLDITLGAASGDPWADIDRYDVFATLMREAGVKKGAQVIDAVARFKRITDPNYAQKNIEELVNATGQFDNRERLTQRYNRGEISVVKWRQLVTRGMTEGIEDAFGLSSGSLTSIFDSGIRRGSSPGNAFQAIFGPMDGHLQKIGERALRKIMNRRDEVLIPASLANTHLGVRPEVKPRYIGLASDTLLARTLFEADYLGKSLIEMPDLRKRISRYQTQFVFYGKDRSLRSPMGKSITQRLWISIDRAPITQSPDGHSLSIGDVSMKFNIADVANGGARGAGGYDQLLTSLYDDLAGEFPVLHELREAAKLAAASRWLQARWPDFNLPSNGQARWQGPAKLPGIVYLMWEPKGARVQIAAVGGVSMVPPIGPSGPVNAQTVSTAVPSDTSVVDLSKSSLTVTPEAYTNTAMRRVLSKKIDVPVPRPPGWVVRATKGERTLKSLNVVVPKETAKCNAETWRELEGQLATVRATARQLASVETAINAITLQGPARQAEFANLERDLIAARQEFVDTSIQIVSQGLLDSKDVIRNQVSIVDLGTLNQSIDAWQEVDGMVADAEGKLKDLTLAWQVASADDIEARDKAAKDLFEYARDLFADADIKGDDTLSRSRRAAGKTFARLNKVKDALAYGNTLFTLGQAAVRMKTLGSQTTKESNALRDSLLPMHTQLLDRLNAQLKNPLVRDWMEKRAKVDC